MWLFKVCDFSFVFCCFKLGKFSFPDEEWEHVSDGAKDYIKKLLTFKPEERPSASQCLEHDWLKNNNKKQVNTTLSKKCLNNMRKFHAGRKLQQAALRSSLLVTMVVFPTLLVAFCMPFCLFSITTSLSCFCPNEITENNTKIALRVCFIRTIFTLNF